MQLTKSGSAVRCTMVAPSYIDTGMFDGVKMRFPLLLPILEQERVADRIVKAVRRGTAEVQMPALVNTIDALRGLLPTVVFDSVSRMLGVSVALDDFVQTRHNARL